MRPFLNLTHHPSANWGVPQLDAAKAITQSGIIDVTFPEVDPTLDEQAVRSLGIKLLKQIDEIGPAAALVQGEPILTYLLVQELEKRGVPCYAASTQRRVVESTRDGGIARKDSIFEFVRFRRYRLTM